MLLETVILHVDPAKKKIRGSRLEGSIFARQFGIKTLNFGLVPGGGVQAVIMTTANLSGFCCYGSMGQMVTGGQQYF